MCAAGNGPSAAACYAGASGAADFAMELGVEKLKDTGYGGMPGGAGRPSVLQALWNATRRPPGNSPARHRLHDRDRRERRDLKKGDRPSRGETIRTRKNPHAHLQKASTQE